MDIEQLRAALADFLGDEQYRKFIKTVCNCGRLLFWQESAWAQFVRVYPNYSSLSVEEIRNIFRICEVHGNELQGERVETTLVHYDFAENCMKAASRLFPHASRGPVMVNKIPPPDGRVQIWYCEECRKANAAWMRQHS